MRDPRERANLKARQPERYDQMVAAWEAWSATMLPLIPDSFAEGYTAAQLADHIGMVTQGCPASVSAVSSPGFAP